ncbi:EF-hand domain-containing protein [Pseudoscourfieldia marina]
MSDSGASGGGAPSPQRGVPGKLRRSLTIDGVDVSDIGNLSDDLKDCLLKFDADNNGNVALGEIERAAQMFHLGNSPKGGNISLGAFPESLQATLMKFDLDGDGFISQSELAAAAELYVRQKRRASVYLRIGLGLMALLFTALASLAGTTYAMIELTKETHTDMSSGLMTVKGSAEVPVKTAQTNIPSELMSCLPNAFFRELQRFEVTKGLAHIDLVVLGYARLPSAKSKYGTTVQLVTHIGRIVLDGTEMTFVDDIGHIFKDAGFELDRHDKRRLLGLLFLFGFLVYVCLFFFFFLVSV